MLFVTNEFANKFPCYPLSLPQNNDETNRMQAVFPSTGPVWHIAGKLEDYLRIT